MLTLSRLLTSLRAKLDPSQDGATMVEYGLMIALVAIIAMVAIGGMGDTLSGLFEEADTALGG